MIVGNEGTILRSVDAISWLPAESGTRVDLVDVAYGNGVLVAAGISGPIATSPDGETWAAIPSVNPEGLGLCIGVAYGHGHFVAMMRSGNYFTSPTGQEWTEQAIASEGNDFSLSQVIFAAGKFLAVGTEFFSTNGFRLGKSAILVSDDGESWSSHGAGLTLPGTTGEDRLLSVTHGNGLFVASGKDGGIAASKNGSNWSVYPGPSGAAFTFHDGQFYGGALHKSSDGINWEEVVSPLGNYITSLASDGRTLVAVGREGNIAYLSPTGPWRQINGVRSGLDFSASLMLSDHFSIESWRPIPGLSGGRPVSTHSPLGRPAFGNGRFVAGGDRQGQVSWSDNGTDWSPGTLSNEATLLDVIYAQGKWVGVGYWTLAESTDGITWTSQRLPGIEGHRSIAYGNGRFVAVGFRGAARVSENGSDWTFVQTPSDKTLSAVAFGNEKFVAVGDMSSSGNGWVSSNGETWSAISWPPPPEGGYATSFVGDVIYEAGYFVASRGNDILVSADGLNWSVQPRVFTPINTYNYYLGYANGRFLAFANANTIYWSEPDDSELSVITKIPEVTRVSPGESAALSFAAIGENLTYQWFQGSAGDTSAPIDGANEANYNSPAITADAKFWVRVRNTKNELISETYAVKVDSAVTVGAPDPTQEVIAGNRVTFTADVVGAPAPTLQWYEGESGDTSIPLAGETRASLSIVAEETRGRFWLRAMNGHSTADSEVFSYVPWIHQSALPRLGSVRNVEGRLIGTSGHSIYASEDGTKWSFLASIFNSYLKDVAPLGDGFIAIGDRGFFTSPDLEKWTLQNAPSSGQYHGADDLAVGNGRAVAVRRVIESSSDGINWVTASLPTGVYIESVEFTFGRFYAGGYLEIDGDPRRQEVGVIFSSIDGLQWERITAGTLRENESNAYTKIDQIDFVHDRLFAISSRGQRLLSSKDGLTWERQNLPENSSVAWTSMSRINNRFLLLTGTHYAISEDGINWAATAFPPALSISLLYQFDGSLFGMGDDGLLIQTTDGLDWELISGQPTTFPFREAVHGAGKFLGFMTNSTYASTDGIRWTKYLPSIASVSFGPVYANGKFATRHYWTSRRWWYESTQTGRWRLTKNIPGDPTGQNLEVIGNAIYTLPGYATEVAESNGTAIAIGRQVWLSTDAETWRSVLPGEGNDYRAIAYGAGQFVIGGQRKNDVLNLFTSPDGEIWTQHELPEVRGSTTDLIFDGRRFFLSSDSAQMFYSDDGTTWHQTQNVPSLTNLLQANGQLFSPPAWRRAWDGVSTRFEAISEDTLAPIGSNVNLEVTAAGANLTYQWYLGRSGDTSSPISGANGSALAVTVSSPESYWVRVQGERGTVESNTMRVAIQGPPTILDQPLDTAVQNLWDTKTLHVRAEGIGPLKYQWYEGVTGDETKPLTGAVSSRLLVSHANYTRRFWVKVENGLGSTNSESATVESWERFTFYPDNTSVTNYDITFGNEKFVAVGESRKSFPFGVLERKNVTRISNNGHDWESAETPVGFRSIAWGNGQFIATSWGLTYRSTNAEVWEPFTIAAAPLSVVEFRFLGGYFWGTNSQNGTLSISDDSLTWRHQAVFESKVIGMAHGDDRFVILGESGEVAVFTDLENWDVKTVVVGDGLVSIVFDGSQFVATTNQGSVWKSRLGDSWEEQETLRGEYWQGFEEGFSIIQQNGVISGTHGTILATRDGKHWFERPPTSPIFKIANGKGQTVALVGSSTSGASAAMRLLPEITALPKITLPPQPQTVSVGDPLTMTVEIEDATLASFQWRLNDTLIAGATSATYSVPSTTIRDAGTYYVDINNGFGTVVSQTAMVDITNGSMDVAGTHTTLVRGYRLRRSLTISNTITYAGDIDTLNWQVLLPDGWSTIASVGSDGATGPELGTTQLGEWTWANPPASPFDFSYSLAVPAETSGPQEIVALVEAIRENQRTQSIVQPDPLILTPAPHSGDTDGDFRIGLSELLRVIELYNTRVGSTRTGKYRTGADSIDGFDPDTTDSSDSTLIEYHSADTDRDRRLSLSELLRVIELYNQRSGTTRTGNYQISGQSDDGYQPGP